MEDIYTINIQGLLNLKKKIKLIQFLNKYKPKIVFLQESNIDNINDQFLIPNYRIFYNFAITKGNGTIIYIRNIYKTTQHSIVVPGRIQRLNVEFFNNDEVVIYNILIIGENFISR